MSTKNQVKLMGRVVEKQLDIKENKDTKKQYLAFTIAINERYKNNEVTSYFRVVTFGNTAQYIFKYLAKNGRIMIDGMLRNNNYTDEKGVKHYGVNVYATNVEIIDFINSGEKEDPLKELENSTIPQVSYSTQIEDDYSRDLAEMNKFVDNEELGK